MNELIFSYFTRYRDAMTFKKTFFISLTDLISLSIDTTLTVSLMLFPRDIIP